MKTISTFDKFKWLVKRELWEHKVAFVWTPVVVCGTALILMLILFARLLYSGKTSIILSANGARFASSEAVAQGAGPAFGATYLSFIGLAAFAAGICVSFYCLNALFDDRRDRSVLLWKSLPLSDAQTVLSKVFVALAVAPTLALMAGLVSAFVAIVATLIGSMVQGVAIGAVLSDSRLYLAPLQLAALIPIAAIWALPTIGWLLLVSAWARGRPMLWAIGIPLVTGALVSFAIKFGELDWEPRWFWENIVGRSLLSAMPTNWFSEFDMTTKIAMFGSKTDVGALLTNSLQIFGKPNIWIGAIVGIAMIYAAIQLRRWRDEG